MRTEMRQFALAGAAGAALVVAAAGCAHVKVDPIQVQTIHIVHDVNIHVDKELNDYFAFEEQRGAASTQPATTRAAAEAQPAAAVTGDVK